MFLSFRELRAARGRSLTMGSVLALVAMLVVIVTGFTNGLTDDTTSAIRTMNASHLVFSEDATSAQFTRSLLDRSAWQRWAAQPGLSTTPFGTTITRGRTTRGVDVEMSLFGVVPRSFLAPRVTHGSPVGSGPSRSDRGVVVSAQIADRGVRIGDEIVLDRLGVRLPVVGVSGRSSFGHVAAVYAPLATWQRVRFALPGGGDLPPGAVDQATGIAVQVKDGVPLTVLDHRYHTRTLTRTAAYVGAPGYQGESTIMNTIRVFLYLISALVVGAFFVVTTIQRRNEIAVIKALGASWRFLLADTICQAALLVGPAVIIGGVGGAALGRLLQEAVPFTQSIRSIAGAAAILVITGVVGAVVAMQRLTRVDPLVALGANR